MKKLLTFVAVAAIALTATNSSARYFGGSTFAGDGTWQGANNWSDDWSGPAPTPDAATAVDIIDIGGNVTVAAPGAVAGSVSVGVNGWNGRIDVAVAGDLSVAGNVLFQSSAGFTGTVVNAGQINVGGLVAFQDGFGVLENNGTFNAAGQTIYLANTATSGTLLKNTGSIVADTLFLSTVGTSQFDMNGGTVSLNTLWWYEGAGATGHLNLHGGTITATLLTLDSSYAGYTVDVTDGIMTVGGDMTADLNILIANGSITGFGGAGTVSAVFDGGSNTTTLSAIPEPATLGMLAAMGGGILFIRRKFTI